MTQSKIDMYSLIPPLCQAMTLDNKGKAVSIFQQHDCACSVECLVEIKTTLGVVMVDMYSIQQVIWLVIDHPNHINRCNEDVPIVVLTPAEVEALESN